MARKNANPTANTLSELEATGDRLAEWASRNAALILGVVAGILVLAAGVGFWVQHGASQRDAAADALARATSEYRRAMGADPSGGAVPEPANAALAERTRTEFAARFETLGQEYAGTTAGAIAMLEAGELNLDLGQLEEAAANFAAARDGARGSAIGALASTRLAGLAEARGDMKAAAQAFEAAAAIPAYPLRGAALADAARCWAAAGEPERAMAAFQRLEAEFPDERIPPAIQALIAELRMEGGA